MLSTKTLLQSLRIAIVIGVAFVGTAGLFNTQLAAQDAADLTTLSDGDISAYRWEAMADYYGDGSTLVDLTTLSDGDISAYRWEAMADYYGDGSTLVDLTTLSDEDISAYRWEATAEFFAEQSDIAALTVR